MNRKSIVNENFLWPEINEQNSAIIIKFLEDFFAKEPNLKRKKTLPKKVRKHRDKNKTTSAPDFGLFIKKNIKIGINSISKALEKNPSNVVLVLVCKSCKPLTVLTRHIHVMCSLSKTPAGCIHNLNQLSKVFNIKTVSALAICKTDETKLEEKEQFNKLYNNFLDQIQQSILPYLIPINNPFTSINFLDSNLLLEDVNYGLDNIELGNDENLKKCKNEETFGSDFISINSSNIGSFIDFDNENFILFKDEAFILEKMEE